MLTLILLDATIEHLKRLKDRGVRFVSLSPQTLAVSGPRRAGCRRQEALTASRARGAPSSGAAFLEARAAAPAQTARRPDP